MFSYYCENVKDFGSVSKEYKIFLSISEIFLLSNNF